jgi:serine/threonine protein phosphatase PrpC
MIIANRTWQAVEASVIGESHIKHGIPNQDAVKTEILSDDIIVSAVADGHGSKKCFRSDYGAHLAVEATILIAKHLHEEWLEEEELNTKKIGKYYTKKIVKQWQEQVDAHIESSPFLDEEINELSESEKKSIQKNPRMVYGSTLLIVVLIKHYIVCYQLGDGDILFVSKNKNVSRPLKKDSRHLANDTLSLCLNKPEKEFNIRVFRDTKGLLEMVMLSTDGYGNSFSNEGSFQKVGIDFVTMIEEDGISVIDDCITAWLEETTKFGSGDDISVSLLNRKRET